MGSLVYEESDRMILNLDSDYEVRRGRGGQRLGGTRGTHTTSFEMRSQIEQGCDIGSGNLILIRTP